MFDNQQIIKSKDLDLLFGALAQAQEHLQNPTKSASGYGYKYAPLDEIITHSRTKLSKFGLTVIQLPIDGGTENEVGLLTQLNHSSGQHFGAIQFCKVETLRGQSHIQSVGSYLTYLRRYAVQSLLYLAAEEDTDGASKPGQNKAQNLSPKKEPNEEPKKVVKKSDKHLEAIALAEGQLEEVDGWEWAESIGFTPSKASLSRLDRFNKLSPDEVKQKVDEFSNTKKEAA